MTFALAAGWIVLGLAAISAGLFALQRLRVRHRTVPVVTTLFWKQAVEEARARVLVQRFRHLPAYLLLLLICSLLWLGFAEPTSDASDGLHHVLLLDASAGMAEGERFEDAKEALLADVAGMPAAQREVIYCGGHVRTLLAPGESALLLEKRLEGLAPEQAPSSLARVARSVRMTSDDIALHVYGDADKDVGISALGIAPAANGRWDQVDVQSWPAASLALSKGPGEAAIGVYEQVNSSDGGSPTTGLWHGMEARGGRLFATVSGRTHEVALPDRRVIRVSFGIGASAELRALVEPVLRADAGVELVAEGGDVVIDVGWPLDTDTAWLIFAEKPKQTVLVQVKGAEQRDALNEFVTDLGLAEVDGATLANALQREITVVGREPATAEGRDARLAATTITVDAALLAPSVGFTSARAFPLLIAGALRRLVGAPPIPPYVAAGEPIATASGGWLDASGTKLDPVGVPFTPPVVGDYSEPGEGGRTLHASLQVDPQASAASLNTADAAGSGGGFPVGRLLALLAFALLLLEWVLFQRGRMP